MRANEVFYPCGCTGACCPLELPTGKRSPASLLDHGQFTLDRTLACILSVKLHLPQDLAREHARPRVQRRWHKGDRR